MEILESKIIEDLYLGNEDRYNILKASEELQELSLELTKMVTKPDMDDKRVQSIIDEIGDVKVRLAVVEKMFSKDKIEERVRYKLDKFRKYTEDKVYKNI